MSARLPLFPLSSVLVPGLVLELHIFEPRYRVLVEALMALPESAVRQFGVIAVRPGPEVGEGPPGEPVDVTPPAPQTYPVGCTADLREVTPYSDGRFDIVTVGERRFRLLEIDEEAGTPFLTGLVEFLDEPDGAEPADLDRMRAAVGAGFAGYQRALEVGVTELPDDPRVVSYLVSAAMVLELPQRQELLEAPTTAHRLRAEQDLLRQERAVVGQLAALPTFDIAETRISRN